MSKARLAARNFVVDAAFCLWFYAMVACGAFFYFRETNALYRVLPYVAVPFILCWLMRRYARAGALFWPLHGLLLAGMIWLQWKYPAAGLPIKISAPPLFIDLPLGRLCVIANVAYSSRRRFSRGSSEPELGFAHLVFFLSTLIAAAVLCEHWQMTAPLPFLAAAAALLCLLQLLFAQMFQIDHSLEIITRTSKQPVSYILPYNNKMMALFAALAALVALVFYLFLADSGLSDALRSAGAFIMDLLRRLNMGGGEPEAPVVAAPPDASMDMAAMFVMEEPSGFLLFIGTLIRYFFTLLSIISLIVAAILIFNGVRGIRLPRHRVEIGGPEDISESVAPGLVETLSRRFAFLGREPANRVRRAFYKKVRRYRRPGADIPFADSDTADEMAQKIKPREDIDPLTAEYQAARYAQTKE